jgi:hypothetical protein
VSNLLLDEYPLLLLPKLACLIGVNEAVVVQQLHFWSRKSGQERDGFIWVHKTYEEWHQDFPFWSVETIKREFRSLEKSGHVVSTSKYNRMKIDRTKWYRIEYSLFSRRADSPVHEVNLTRPSGQLDPLSSGQLDPSNNHRQDHQDQTKSTVVQVYTFDEFYADYPNKKSPADAEKAWRKLNPDAELQAAIRDGLASAKNSAEWARDDGRFIPYPASWLKAHGWKSEYKLRGNDNGNNWKLSTRDRIRAANADDLGGRSEGTSGPTVVDGEVLARDG